MTKITKSEANKRLRSIGSPMRIIGEPNGIVNKVMAKCQTHKYEYEPYLGNVLRGAGCPECRKDKISAAPKYTVPQDVFTERLLRKNEHARVVYYTALHKPAKISCLKCGCARTDEARNFLVAGCQDCKLFNLTKLKKERTRAYYAEVAARKKAKIAEHIKVLCERVEASEHVMRVGAPYLDKRNNWRCLVECKYCTGRFYARTSNLHVGSKCKKCSMRWAKSKEVELGNKTVRVQGYEPQALHYIVNVIGIPANNIETEKVPRIGYVWYGKKRWYYPDFLVNGRTFVEVKSEMTLGLGGWWGKAKPPFEKNKAKHQAVLESGYRFKLLVIDKNGRVAELPKKWLTMTKAEVRALVNEQWAICS